MVSVQYLFIRTAQVYHLVNLFSKLCYRYSSVFIFSTNREDDQ